MSKDESITAKEIFIVIHKLEEFNVLVLGPHVHIYIPYRGIHIYTYTYIYMYILAYKIIKKTLYSEIMCKIDPGFFSHCNICLTGAVCPSQESPYPHNAGALSFATIQNIKIIHRNTLYLYIVEK